MNDKETNREYSWTDKQAGIHWERYNPATPLEYQDYNELVNVWSSDKAIQTFIHFDEPIADTFKLLLETDSNNKEGFFYAFDEDRLAGVVYITSPSEILDETYIEYLIVNPKLKGHGIGTRIISSIKSNPTFFSENHMGKFAASIEHTNEASKRVFIKNGFKMYRPVLNEKLIANGVLNVHNLNLKFGKWYFNEREMENDK